MYIFNVLVVLIYNMHFLRRTLIYPYVCLATFYVLYSQSSYAQHHTRTTHLRTSNATAMLQQRYSNATATLPQRLSRKRRKGKGSLVDRPVVVTA